MAVRACSLFDWLLAIDVSLFLSFQEQTLRDIITSPRGRTRSIVVAPEVSKLQTSPLCGGALFCRALLEQVRERSRLPPTVFTEPHVVVREGRVPYWTMNAASQVARIPTRCCRILVPLLPISLPPCPTSREGIFTPTLCNGQAPHEAIA